MVGRRSLVLERRRLQASLVTLPFRLQSIPGSPRPGATPGEDEEHTRRGASASAHGEKRTSERARTHAGAAHERAGANDWARSGRRPAGGWGGGGGRQRRQRACWNAKSATGTRRRPAEGARGKPPLSSRRRRRTLHPRRRRRRRRSGRGSRRPTRPRRRSRAAAERAWTGHTRPADSRACPLHTLPPVAVSKASSQPLPRARGPPVCKTCKTARRRQRRTPAGNARARRPSGQSRAPRTAAK